MKIYIKNMVCDRCRWVVGETLEKLGLSSSSILLGEIDFGSSSLQSREIESLKSALKPLGFELIDDRKGRLIEGIKRSIISHIHRREDLPDEKLSRHLQKELRYDYNYLSNLFSSVEGITIEKYLILQKVEKVKELIVYDELSLTEIAYRLGYSSLAHLSGQFKKVTGLTPSHFRRRKNFASRKPLDKVTGEVSPPAAKRSQKNEGKT